MSDAERDEAMQPGEASGDAPGENFDLDSLKTILEGVLLAAARPLSLDQLQTLMGGETGPDKGTLRRALDALEEDCAHRAVELVEVASGFRLQVRQELQPWVAKLWEERPPRYSRALLETLALIAYRQPITRGEIEDVRGVSVSTNIIRQLEEREWIRVVGHRDVPGKPALFGTTKAFLDYFGLKNLDDLPSLAELRDIDSLEPELDFSGGSESKGDRPDESESGATDEAEALALAAESDEETGTDPEGSAEASPRNEEDATAAEVEPGSAESADDETPEPAGAAPAGEAPDADAGTSDTGGEADAPEVAADAFDEPIAGTADEMESAGEPEAEDTTEAEAAEADRHSGEPEAEDADDGTDAPRDESLPDDDESPDNEAASAGRR